MKGCLKSLLPSDCECSFKVFLRPTIILKPKTFLLKLKLFVKIDGNEF